MNYDTIDCLLVFLIYMVPFMLLLVDYVFPRIPFLNRWLESLPEFEEDEE